MLRVCVVGAFVVACVCLRVAFAFDDAFDVVVVFTFGFLCGCCICVCVCG